MRIRAILLVIPTVWLIMWPVSAAAEIIFNEIAWMGMLPQGSESSAAAANNEWIELYNSSGNSVSLAGWKVISEDGAPNIDLQGSIAPGGYFLLERGSDSLLPGIVPDFVYPYKNALSNSGERLYLKDSVGVLMDEINAANDGWPAGDNSTKNTMQRTASGWITAEPTPKEKNENQDITAGNDDSAANQKSLSSDDNIYSAPVSAPVIPKIKAFAGEDVNSVAGGSIEFMGNGFGLENKPLENARFWWNFGDGDAREGRVVSHIFKFPGDYIVGFHITSGEYEASDYLKVKVIPNQTIIKNVVFGKDGFLAIANQSPIDIDIGGWRVQDANNLNFIFPPQTILGRKSEISLANSISGMNESEVKYPVVLKYSNGEEIFSFSPKTISVLKNSATGLNISEIKPKPKQESKPILIAPEASTFGNDDILQTEAKDNTATSSPFSLNQSSVSSADKVNNLYFYLVLAAILSAGASIAFIFLKKDNP